MKKVSPEKTKNVQQKPPPFQLQQTVINHFTGKKLPTNYSNRPSDIQAEDPVVHEKSFEIVEKYKLQENHKKVFQHLDKL